MINRKIVILGSKGTSTNIVFHSLNSEFGIYMAVIENKESLKTFLKRRIKKLGYLRVLGQILFQIIVVNILNFYSRKRKDQIIKDHGLNIAEIPENKKRIVNSVNSDATVKILQEVNPDLIIVNGTRIISERVLNCVNCKFINIHTGITPKYRGVHGMYWALINDDIENSGVTVHFVDTGIDTGKIIFQAKVTPRNKDNFVTYQFLQLSEGLKILKKAIEAYLNGNIETETGILDSYLWYHPTIWQYLYYRIVKKVK